MKTIITRAQIEKALTNDEYSPRCSDCSLSLHIPKSFEIDVEEEKEYEKPPLMCGPLMCGHSGKFMILEEGVIVGCKMCSLPDKTTLPEEIEERKNSLFSR